MKNKRTNRWNNIIWDLDGTLVDSQEAVIEIMKKTAEKMELDDDFQYDRVELFIGPSTEKYLDNCFPHWSEEKKALYRMHSDEISRNSSNDLMKLYDGVIEIVKNTKNSGAANYICTAKDELSAIKLLEEFGVNDLFEGIYGSREDMRDKRDIIGKMLENNRLAGEDCVMIGDRYTDIMGGKLNNTRTIAVLYGYGTASELAECDPDYIAKDTGELQDLLLIVTEL